MGCGGTYRQAAMLAQDEAQRLVGESTYDLYAIAVKSNMALAKAKLHNAVKDGTIDAKIDPTINEMSQNIVNAGWLKENITVAKGYMDQAWIYMSSRQSFIEVLIKDLRKASRTTTTQPIN